MAKVYITTDDESKLSNPKIDMSCKNGGSDALNEEKMSTKYLATGFEVWSLGVAVVLGGQFYGWNRGFVQGFGTYAIGQVLMGLAFICLMVSLAEITSTIPFSGGAFGLARVCLGFYPGFVVGYLQLLSFIIYSSSVVVFCSQILAPYFGTSRYCEWIFWLMYYGFTTAVVWNEDRKFWLFNVFLAVVSLGLIVIYVLPSFTWVNFNEFAPLNVNYIDDPIANAAKYVDNQWFVGGMGGFLTILPFTTWAYAGVESMAMTTSVMKDAQNKLPIVMIISMMTLFITNMLLLFVIGSQPPGLAQTASTDFPMNYGYNRIFNTNDEVSIALTVIPNFAMGYGFIPPSTRLVASLGQSRLFPSFLRLEDPKNERYGLIFVQLVGILFCIVGYYSDDFAEHLNNIAILAGFITYFSMLIGFLMLRGRFNNLERKFRSPLGVPGAIFAMVIFALGFIAIAGGFENDNGIAIATNAGVIALCTIYYFSPGGPSQRQILNKEETATIFRMNVINANLRKKRGKSHRWLKQSYITIARLSKVLDSGYFDSNVSQSGTGSSHIGRRNSFASFGKRNSGLRSSGRDMRPSVAAIPEEQKDVTMVHEPAPVTAHIAIQQNNSGTAVTNEQKN